MGLYARNVRIRFLYRQYTPTFLYFNLYLNTAYAAHYVYFTIMWYITSITNFSLSLGLSPCLANPSSDKGFSNSLYTTAYWTDISLNNFYYGCMKIVFGQLTWTNFERCTPWGSKSNMYDGRTWLITIQCKTDTWPWLTISVFLRSYFYTLLTKTNIRL